MGFPIKIFENTKCLARHSNRAEDLGKISDFLREVSMEETPEVPEVAQAAAEVNILRKAMMMTSIIKSKKENTKTNFYVESILLRCCKEKRKFKVGKKNFKKTKKKKKKKKKKS